MSIIMGVVTNKFVVMSSDSRAEMIDSDGTTIYRENFKKIFRVNDNTVIGFTGNSPISVLNSNGLLDIEDINPKEYCEILFDMLGGGEIVSSKSFNVLILGKYSTVAGFGGSFHTDDGTLQNSIIINDEKNIWTPILPPPTIDYKEIQQYYRSIIVNEFINSKEEELIEKIKKINEELIRKVAEIDSSVNRRCRHIIISFENNMNCIGNATSNHEIAD